MTSYTPNREVRFEPDYSAARFVDGTVVKFTRLERRALAFLNESAGRILTRAQILDAISEPGSEKNDRTIDFLINRIRTKLDDDAHAPRYIETRYGEGYVWLRGSARNMADYSAMFAVIGPFVGTQCLGDLTGCASELADFLQADLRQLLRHDQKTTIAPDLSEEQRMSGPELSLQLAFFRNRSGLECIVTARGGRGDKIVSVSRFPLGDGPDQRAALSSRARDIAGRALSALWRETAESGATAKPLSVAMYGATRPRDGIWSWNETDRRLRPLRETQPDDPALKMMWAAHIYSRYFKHGVRMFRDGTANCSADEAEIERLVLDSLDFAQDRPEHAAMAAKLLYFVDRGYKDLALTLATKAHGADTSVNSTLAILGQLLGFLGEMEEAEAHLAQAVELSEGRPMEYVYSLYMLMQVCAAAGHRDKLSAALTRLYRRWPAAIPFFEPYFADPVSPSLRARAIALVMKRAKATAMMQNLAYLSARLYLDPRHRENTLLGTANLFVKRFGPSVVPEEAAIHLPGLVRRGRP